MPSARIDPVGCSHSCPRADFGPGERQPKPLDRLRKALRTSQYGPHTEQEYCQWACLPRREESRRRQVKMTGAI